MNTFKLPIIFVCIFIAIGAPMISIGLKYEYVHVLWLGAILVGIALGIGFVNAYPKLFLDKNSTDIEWNKI